MFIHFPADEHLDCFPFRAIMNKASLSIHVQVSLWTYVFTGGWGVEILDMEFLSHWIGTEVNFIRK